MTVRSLSLLALLVPSLASADSVALKAHKKSVQAVAITADGARIASAGDDDTIIVWDKGAAGPTHTVEGPVLALAFSPDGKLVASGSMYGKLAVWNPATNKDLFEPKKAHEGNILHIAFFPDGKTFVTAGKDQKLKLWDAATGAEKATLAGPKYAIHGLALARDGKQLVSCDSNGGVTSWNLKTNKPTETRALHKGECNAVALSPDGTSLAAGYGDGTVVIVDAASGKERLRAQANDQVNALAYAGAATLVVGTRGEELQLADTATGKLTSMKGHSRPVRSVAASADGAKIVSGSMDMTVRQWTK